MLKRINISDIMGSVDSMPKNAFPMYDCDTIQNTSNFIPSNEFIVRVIDGTRVYFEPNEFAYTEIIYSTHSGNYCYKYAFVYNGKLVALGEEQGRIGGVTHVLTKENNPRAVIEKLGKSNESDDKLLYEKIKGMEIANAEELPQYPKPIYHMSDNFINHYYINDNTDGTFTLWLANNEKYDGEELCTKPDLNDVLAALFNEICRNKSFIKKDA